MSEQKAFKTEVQKLLDLVIHSLYSNKEIFLRELISNASDAIDRARFLSLTDQNILENKEADWKIKIGLDKKDKTLTISDNGIGMSEKELDDNLGTIASSGTKRFLEELQKNKDSLSPELIGQFGVGFYSAFMVASEVTVITRQAGGEAHKWYSKGDGFYTIEPATRESRGTDVIVKLTPENEVFLDEWKIRKTVTRFSNYVEHPICMDVTKQEPELDKDGKAIEGKYKSTTSEETLNSMKAIWQKSKAEIKPEEYNDFYHQISHDFTDPLTTIHWSVEGQTEFRALIYIPEKTTFDMYMPDIKDRGVQLYVHRVFITDKCKELIPSYLRFLRGVVDSSDLPLNVSREILQDNKIISLIQKNIVKKVLDSLADMKDKDYDKYLKFWNVFGAVLKEGLHMDWENKEKIQELLLFDTSNTVPDKKASLAEYVSRMPPAQKEIFYITAEDRQTAANSPQLEAFKSKGYEVLFCTDNVDEWIMGDMMPYKEKAFRCITKGDVNLDSDEEKSQKEEERKQNSEVNKGLLESIKKALGDKVKDVRLSNRLTESACCLVAEEGDMGVRMEKIMKVINPDTPEAKRILELNPTHPLIENMRRINDASPDNPKLPEYAQMLYDEALLTAQIPLADPLAFAKRISALLNADAQAELTSANADAPSIEVNVNSADGNGDTTK